MPLLLCAGGTDDFVVDPEGVKETAEYYNTTPVSSSALHDWDFTKFIVVVG